MNKCIRVDKKKLCVGDRVRWYNMYSKRYRNDYIVEITKHNSLGVSGVKGGGTYKYLYPDEVKKVK